MKGLRALFNLGNFQCILYAYACSKHLIKGIDKSGYAENVCHIIKRLILALVILLVNFLVLTIFTIYYEIVNFILLLKHGRNYLTILDGSDVIWVAEDKSRNLINALYMMDPQENDSSEILFEHFRTAYGELSTTHPKLSCVRKQYMGYWYFLKTKININQFVNYMDNYNNMEELQILLDKYSSSPLPLKDTALWEIYVGKTKVDWKGNPGKNLYPVLVKYHHSLGDGISIIGMMISNLLKGGVEIMKENCESYRKIIENYNKRNRITMKEKLVKILKREVYIKHFPILASEEINSLHSGHVSGEKHLCWILEDSGKKYLDKVKDIKKQFPGSSFTDVVLAAFSASISEYLKQNDKCPPNSIRAALTYYVTSSEFDKIIKINNGNAVSKLENNFSIGVVNAPIRTGNIEDSLEEMIQAVKNDSGVLKDALDTHFIYWQLKVLSTILPYPIIKQSLKTNDKITVAVTNVPGHKTGTIHSGHVIHDTIIWAPNFLATGISFSIFTYDEKFRFGLLVDKAVIKNRKDVESIGDNVFKYIDLMHKAIKQKQCAKN